MPSPPSRKAAIFAHLKMHLAEDDVLFGATVLGKGVEHNCAGRFLTLIYKKGVYLGIWMTGLRYCRRS